MADLRSGTTIGGYAAVHVGMTAVALPGTLSVSGVLTTANQIQAMGGAPGAPSYSFGGDTTTGIYRMAANTLAFATGGTARMTIDTAAVNLPGVSLNISGTTVISSARVLQNVTTDAAIITAGTLADARLSTNVALKNANNTFSTNQDFISAGTIQLRLRQTADTQFRLLVDNNGLFTWGPGTAVGDTNLYRSAASTLKTDSSLVVAGSLTVGGRVIVATDKVVDAALSANVALKDAVGTWTVGQMVNRLKHMHGNITSAEYDGVGAGGYGAYQASAYSNGSSTFIGNFFHYTALHAVYADLGAGAGYGFYAQGAYASPIIQILGTSSLNTFTADTPVKALYRYQVISATVATPQSSPTRITNTNATWLFGVNSNNAFEVGQDFVVGGAIVLTSARTLQNVSASAAIINSGTLADARLSSNVPLKDAVNVFTSTQSLVLAAPGTTAVGARYGADTGYRWYSQANGALIWGDGAGVYDTNLYRSAADTLKTDDSFVVGGSLIVAGTSVDVTAGYVRTVRASGASTFLTRVSGDTGYRWYVTADGLHNWGDGTNAPDTQLARTAVSTLTLTGSLAISSNLTITGSIIQNGYTVPYGPSPAQNPGSYPYGSLFYDGAGDVTYGRAVDRPPSHYQKTMLAEFKNRSTLGFYGTASYMGTLTLSAYTDATGGVVTGQFGWVGQTLGWRSGTPGGSTWSSWQQVPLLDANGALTITTGGVGVGTATGGTTGLRVSGTLSWLTTANNYALFSDVVFPATATSSGVAGYFRASTAAAAYTMGGAHGVYIASTGLGAGSTITTNYALYIQDQTVGATNYAIYTMAGRIRFGDVMGIGTVVTNSALTVDIGTSGTSQYGIRATPNFTSGATTNGVAVLAQVRTAAATFTMGTGYSVYVQAPSVGAGSSITNVYGLFMENLTQGASNYAIFTNSGMVRFGDRVGVMTTPASTAMFQVGGTHTSTATAAHGARFDTLMPTTTTVLGEAARFTVGTVAAAFTLGAGIGVRVADAAKGAGSTITTQYGLYVDNQTQGASNYAIWTGTGTVRFGDAVQVFDGQFQTTRATSSDWAFISYVAGDAVARLAVRIGGTMEWGPGASGARDVTLGRSAAGILALTGSLTVSGVVTVTGDLTANTVKIGDMGYGTGWAGLVHKDTAAQGTNYALIQNQAGTDTRLNVATGGTISMYVNSAQVLATFNETATQLGVNGGAVIIGASDIGGTEVLRVNGTTKSTGVSATSTLSVAGRTVGGQIISTAAPSGTAPDGTIWYQV